MLPGRIILALILTIGFSALNAAETNVTITTFNIRMFGYRADEARQPALKEFLQNSVPASDIFVFEEIMNTSLVKDFLPENWSCLNYDDSLGGTQHVTICHSPRFVFSREPSDNNDVIDEVAGPRNSLRPALTAIVSDTSGKQLFRIVGVHLKAIPDYSKVRVEQSQIISDYLSKVENKNLPVVIAGDYNSYPIAQNKQPENDIDLILKAFNTNVSGIKRIPNDLLTYRNIYGQLGQFDQFYVSDSIRVNGPLKIFEVCNKEDPKGEGTLDLEYYYKNISDHCPVSANLSL